MSELRDVTGDQEPKSERSGPSCDGLRSELYGEKRVKR